MKLRILTILMLVTMEIIAQKESRSLPCFKLHFSVIKNDNIQKLVVFKNTLLKNDTLKIELTINEMIENLSKCKEKDVNPFYTFVKLNYKNESLNFKKDKISMKELLIAEMKIKPYHNQKYYELNPDDLLNLYFYYQNGLDDQNNWFLKPEYCFSWSFCEAFKQYFDIEFFDSTSDYAHNGMYAIKDIYISHPDEHTPQAPETPFSVKISKENPKLVNRFTDFFKKFKKEYPQDWSNDAFEILLNQVENKNGALIITYWD